MSSALADEAIGAVLARPGPLAQVASGADDPGAFTEDFCRWQEILQIDWPSCPTRISLALTYKFSIRKADRYCSQRPAGKSCATLRNSNDTPCDLDICDMKTPKREH
jgi:hypothetical protein